MLLSYYKDWPGQASFSSLRYPQGGAACLIFFEIMGAPQRNQPPPPPPLVGLGQEWMGLFSWTTCSSYALQCTGVTADGSSSVVVEQTLELMVLGSNPWTH